MAIALVMVTELNGAECWINPTYVVSVKKTTDNDGIQRGSELTLMGVQSRKLVKERAEDLIKELQSVK